MAVQKLQLAAADSLEALMEEPGEVALVANWYKREVEPVLRKYKFKFDAKFSSAYPVNVQYVKPGTEKDADVIIATLTKLYGMPFQRGVQNTYSPYVRLTRKFSPAPGVYGYFVVTLGVNGGLAVRFAM